MKPGAALGIYDVMNKGDESLAFPVPWAQSADTSHLVTPQEMHSLLGDAGFEIGEVEDRTDFALNFFRTSLAAAADGPPPLGIHILLGASAPEKIGNTLANFESGRIVLTQMIARRGAG